MYTILNPAKPSDPNPNPVILIEDREMTIIDTNLSGFLVANVM